MVHPAQLTAGRRRYSAFMGDTPWQGDACSLVDEFRSGRRSPLEELHATYAAIDASTLNAFCYLPREQAERAAAGADVSKPFGGVPIGVKELDQVAGWPDTHASVPLRDDVAEYTSVMVQRIRDDRRRRAGRADHRQRVRRRQPHPHAAARLHAQPVAARPHPRRKLGRHRRGGCGWAVDDRHGRRRRRFDPHSGRLHRPRRPESDDRSHPTWARVPTTATSPSRSAACRARCATPPVGSTSATGTRPATR